MEDKNNKSILPELEYLLKETKELANIFAASLLTMKNKKK